MCIAHSMLAQPTFIIFYMIKMEICVSTVACPCVSLYSMHPTCLCYILCVGGRICECVHFVSSRSM